eukprot:6209200-Pleurochrysis_carterae.AAC.3
MQRGVAGQFCVFEVQKGSCMAIILVRKLKKKRKQSLKEIHAGLGGESGVGTARGCGLGRLKLRRAVGWDG